MYCNLYTINTVAILTKQPSWKKSKAQVMPFLYGLFEAWFNKDSLIIFRIRNVSVPKEMHEFVMNSMKLDERNIVPGAKGDLFSLSLLHFHRYYEYFYNFKLPKSLTRSLFFCLRRRFFSKKTYKRFKCALFKVLSGSESVLCNRISLENWFPLLG